MSRSMKLIATVLFSLSIVFQVGAKQEKKNMPKKYEIKKALMEAGGKHNPEEMKIDKLGSLEVGDTYFHAFKGEFNEGMYRVIFFNNHEEYLGFYDLGKVIPTGVHEDSFYVLGQAGHFRVQIGEAGPPSEIVINENGHKCKFTAVPSARKE